MNKELDLNIEFARVLFILTAYLIGILGGMSFSVWYTEYLIDHGRLPKFLKEKREKLRALLAKEEKEEKEVMNT